MTDTLAILLEQERLLQFTHFDSDAAWTIGSWLVKQAQQDGLHIAIDITVAGHRLFHFAANGTAPDNDAWIERKARSVARFCHSSYYLGRKLRADGDTVSGRYYVDEKEFSFHGGCFPIILKGTGVIGSVTVSGLKQEEDHDLVVQALAYFLKPATAIPRL